MLEKRTKIFILIFLLFTLLATSILITSGRARINSREQPNNLEQIPVRKVDITLAQDQHDQFFEQLRKFADKHDFAIRISQTDPSGENFLVYMRTEDVKVIGVDGVEPGLLKLFKIGFYNTDEDRPVPTRVFDELIIDLKGFIEEIPNTTFTVKE